LRNGTARCWRRAGPDATLAIWDRLSGRRTAPWLHSVRSATARSTT
jgi:hypothetical protein